MSVSKRTKEKVLALLRARCDSVVGKGDLQGYFLHTYSTEAQKDSLENQIDNLLNTCPSSSALAEASSRRQQAAAGATSCTRAMQTQCSMTNEVRIANECGMT